MDDQERTIIQKEWVTAKELNEIRRSDKRQNKDENIGTRLESSQVLPSLVDATLARDTTISNKETVETM